MRLTLRNMLAQMDGILEPDDAQDIAKKIEESSFAANLLHRIRDVARRIRLAAPALNERGPNLDPNTVAEYLDHVLPDDRVPDFENVCLKSDMHLAEVASCHQVLTLVLGEPAEFAPESRQRMYQIPQVLSARQGAEGKVALPDELRAGAAPSVLPATQAAAEAPALPPVESSRPSGVPDYLRDPPARRRVMPTIIGLALILLVAFVVLLATGQFEPGRPLGRLLGMKAADATSENDNTSGKAEAGTKVEQPTGIGGPEKIVPPPEEPAPLPPKTTAADMPPSEAPSPLPAKLADAANTVPPKEVPKPDEAPVPVEPVPATGDSPAKPSEPVPPKDQPPALPVGRLVSDNQVLLRFDPKAATWERVKSKGVLGPQAALLVLPTYRPEISLVSGVTVRQMGAAGAQLIDDGKVSGLQVLFGRFVLIPPAKPGTQVRLVVGAHTGTITFAQAESTAAVEVTLLRPPGTNPETQPSTLSAVLFATSGEISWEENGRPAVRMTATSRLALNGQPPATPTPAEAPRWIVADSINVLDEQASRVIEQSLQGDRPPVQTLLELTEHRKREVRWLATRCLVYLGHIDALVSALNVTDLKADWPEYISKLTEAVALSPQSAAAVRLTFERHYGAAGADLYRMLWGYSQEDLTAGEAARLVNFLEHDNLAFRVLAFNNLRDITGHGLTYRPEYPPTQRRQLVQRWKEKLDAGEIRVRGDTTPRPAVTEEPGGNPLDGDLK